MHFFEGKHLSSCSLAILFAAMMCSFCGKDVHGVNDYVKHVCASHRSEPYFHLMCGIDSCPLTFSRFSSFTSHLCRKHSERLNKRSDNCSNQPALHVTGECHVCQETFTSSNLLFAHLKNHIKTGVTVICPHTDCLKEYSVHSSFTAHLSRNHHPQHDRPTNRDPTFPQRSDAELFTEHYTIQQEEGVSEGRNDINVSQADISYQDEAFLKSLVQSFLKLQECQRLPVSTVNKIVEEMN